MNLRIKKAKAGHVNDREILQPTSSGYVDGYSHGRKIEKADCRTTWMDPRESEQHVEIGLPHHIATALYRELLGCDPSKGPITITLKSMPQQAIIGADPCPLPDGKGGINWQEPKESI